MDKLYGKIVVTMIMCNFVILLMIAIAFQGYYDTREQALDLNYQVHEQKLIAKEKSLNEYERRLKEREANMFEDMLAAAMKAANDPYLGP